MQGGHEVKTATPFLPLTILPLSGWLAYLGRIHSPVCGSSALDPMVTWLLAHSLVLLHILQIKDVWTNVLRNYLSEIIFILL